MDKKKLVNIKNYEYVEQEATKRGISVTAFINLIIFEFINSGNISMLDIVKK